MSRVTTYLVTPALATAIASETPKAVLQYYCGANQHANMLIIQHATASSDALPGDRKQHSHLNGSPSPFHISLLLTSSQVHITHPQIQENYLPGTHFNHHHPLDRCSQKIEALPLLMPQPANQNASP